MKRLFDATFAMLGLILLSPLLLLVVVAIRMESSGAALFAQPRIGRHGQSFTCYKLRTMYRSTANVPSHLLDSAALTFCGKVLRRSKLDELPQLWNVLRGDMSLVGPRPCLPVQSELIEARRSLGVLAVRPGITGLAQVMGIDMSDPARLAEIDGAYVRERTFWGDVVLLLRTLTGAGLGLDPATGDSKVDNPDGPPKD